MLKNKLLKNLSADLTVALAHEVKNPISLIMANIELLELDGIFNSNQKNIAVIKKELNKISKLITDFMLLYQSKDIENIYNFNLFDIIEDVEEEYRITNHKNNISFYLNCFCEPEDTVILCDEFKINMLLSNIYKNALESLKDIKNIKDIKDIKHGQIITNIYIIKDKLIVEIIDNGHGIKQEIKDNIYEPFKTTKIDGSGIGLSICKNIISEIDGDISIRNNELEEGCIVKIIFNTSNNK